jgi:hypothetical protein
MQSLDAGDSGQQFADLVLLQLSGDHGLELSKPCAESLLQILHA